MTDLLGREPKYGLGLVALIFLFIVPPVGIALGIVWLMRQSKKKKGNEKNNFENSTDNS